MVSKAWVTLLISLVSPVIEEIIPTYVPIDNEDYQITVNGTNFHPKQFRYICIHTTVIVMLTRLGELIQDDSNRVIVFATFVIENVFVCPFPRLAPSHEMSFRFFPDTTSVGNVQFLNTSIGPFPLRFYGMGLLSNLTNL